MLPVFTAGRDEEGEQYLGSDVYMMKADGTDERDLTRNANCNEYDPTWSPSEGKIAFAGFRSGDQEIFKIDIDGTGCTNLTNTPDIQEYQPEWGRRPLTQATS